MSTAQAVSQKVNALSVAELEALIRRIVREEIALALEEKYCHSERPEGAKNPVFVLRERDSSPLRSSE